MVPPSSESPSPEQKTPLTFSCDAKSGALLLLYLKTFLLSILTLGIYSFWGRTEIRRYLYSSIRAGGDRFHYHGTGKELLIGWLRAAGIVVALYVVFFLLTLAIPEWGSIVGAVFFYIALLALLPFAIVGTIRYRWSRTSLRGVRFSSRARATEFCRIYYKGLFLLIVTLGFYAPWFAANTHRYLTRTAFYGDQPFDFDGDGRPLFKSYVAFFFLLIPTFYLIAFWFAAKQSRYFWGRTSFRGARFESTIRGRDLLWLAVSNVLIILCTMGLGIAWATIRTMRYSCSVIRLNEFSGFDEINRAESSATATAEGVASILDIDSGFDLGA